MKKRRLMERRKEKPCGVYKKKRTKERRRGMVRKLSGKKMTEQN